ncbi:hypothetical protein H3223_02645 [Pseudomonas toyotomiensis]|nr:hypothetical protein [Pseudomonas toyotomiensis]
MPKYKCHKQVWALKIREVAQGVAPAEHTGGSWLLLPENDRYAAIEVAHDWYARHKPEAGGYYVVYSDGYSSYSPAEAFESGYQPVDVGCSSFVGGSDQSIEQEIQAKGLTAPRITPGDIEANIGTEFYFTAGDGVLGASQMGTKPAGRSDSLNRLTFCVLVMKNGFTVTGESACASAANFDAELGKKIARTNAIAKVWPLMGYALKERLSGE